MTERWFQRLRDGEAASLRLYCFPFAGASHTVYRHWRALLPADIDLALVKLPARGARFNEPPAASIDALARNIADAIANEAPHRVALFGHSMGALLAFETARRLCRIGTAPALLAVSGRSAPATPPRPAVSTLDEPRFIERLRSMQGLPAQVLARPEWLSFFLPIIRADFALCESHRYQPAAALPCPLLVFGGRDDANVPLHTLAAWQNETSAGCRIHELPGHHFFLFEHEARLLSLISHAALHRHRDPVPLLS